MKNLLGGKGANLAEMANIGLPVPPGFTITTEVCTEFYANGKKLPKALDAEVRAAITKMEKVVGAKFGDPSNPLLVSVRSGARASMPGMMDTILNLGLNDKTAEGLAKKSGNARFVYDSYRRFVAMYGDVVLGMKPENKEDHDPFDVILENKKQACGVTVDSELPADALKELVAEFKAEIKAKVGRDFPTDPYAQLEGAIKAVFQSWQNDRANLYRRLNNIPAEWGTAVNVQAMVFGNKGADCATGVCFTRDPASGENMFYGEYLVNAQGEDVVAGIRTPEKIVTLGNVLPKAYKELLDIRKKLEKHYKEMQDIEFTIENGKLYMLQCRNGKRTGFAGVRIAVEMVDEKLITKEEALRRVEPEALNQLLRPVFLPAAKMAAVAEGRLLAKGLPAGPGAATGKVVFFADEAEALAEKGEKNLILCRHETSPEDIRGMNASLGFMTAFGGMTSHAALVARQMGKVCIVGCDALSFDYHARQMKVQTANGEVIVREGDWISIDGFAGEVINGRVDTTPSEVIRVLIEKNLDAKDAPVYQRYAKLMSWADAARKLRVRANADQPDQAEAAVAFGAEGIGLCRTEHMFFGEGKIGPMREMIVAETEEVRRAALDKLLPLQREDFAGLFRAMKGRPGHRPDAGSPAARVPAPRRGGHQRPGRRHGQERRAGQGAHPRPQGIEPDARPPRLPPRDHVSRDHRDAGARDLRGGARRRQRRSAGVPGDHDPARRHQEGARPAGRAGARDRGRRVRRARQEDRLHGRDDDRGAPRRDDRRQDRRDGRVLLVRHQRPDADDVRPVARRRAARAGGVPVARHLPGRSVRQHRPRRRRRAGEDGG